MSSLGDLIDDMWSDADPNATSGGNGCLPKFVRWLIFFVVMGVLIYFMKQN